MWIATFNLVVMFSADYIFRNEHINFLITYPFDFRIEEMLSYYISFLRFVIPISTPSGAAPLVRRPILLIQPLLRRVKPSADRSSPSDRHRHWRPTQLHSHRHRRPRRRCVVLGRLSHIGRLPLCQIHAATVLIRPPLPDPAAAA
jgi:hypothetical protein